MSWKWAAIAVLVVLLLVGGAAVASAGELEPASDDVPGLARKWADARGLPVVWVLATIEVESGGDAHAVGDFHVLPEGASIGLMQVNVHAHGGELAAEGLGRDDLFRPDINIDWGTRVLASSLKSVQRALSESGGGSSVPIADLVRLRYKGVDIPGRLRAGTDPLAGYDTELARWHRALNNAAGVG